MCDHQLTVVEQNTALPLLGSPIPAPSRFADRIPVSLDTILV